MAYVQFVELVNGVGVITVTGGNTIEVFAYDGSSGAAPTGVSDLTQGAYTARTGTAATGDFVDGKMFCLPNANAGAHAITVAATGAAYGFAVEVTAPTSTPISGDNANAQSAPGTSANTLNSGSVPASASATLVGMSIDTSVVNSADAPTAGTSPTSFTSRGSGSNGTIGSWRLMTAAVSAAAAITATAIVGGDNFLTLGLSALEPSGGGPGLMSQACF